MNVKELIENKKIRFLIVSFLFVIPLEILSFFSVHLPIWFELPLFVALILILGRKVIFDGVQSLVNFNFSNINLLMTIAIFGALYLQEFEEAVIIVILFALGNALEDYGIQKSQKSLQELVNATPKSALIKDTDKKTPIEDIKIGQTLIIKSGDYIPLDGVIVKGNSLIDETTITGEPLPKNKYTGELVYAGTINQQGYIEIKVTKTVKDTTLAKIIDLTFKSLEKKSKSQKFIDIFARYYTPSVILISFLLVVVPVFMLNPPFNHWFSEALTLLLISCPCALVISTPITIFSAIGNASKKGMIIKGGKFLEEIGKIRAIAFDKTRTLTEGKPIVSDIIPFNGSTKEDVLACAAGMELLSEHPLGKSIVGKAKEFNLIPHQFTNFQTVTGRGLKGECMICSDTHHCLGNLKFITKEHKVETKIVNLVDKFEKQGKTTIIMSDNGKIKGVISITDKVREESKPTIEKLHKHKIIPVMLTGDNYSSAKYVSDFVGISDIKAELLPEEKVSELKKMIAQYKTVAMVGDGVNDAPALATSTVGISMGALGSDIAVENSDIALMNNNLGLIPYLVGLGKKSVSIIRLNIILALSVKFTFLLLAIVGLSNLAIAIFADVGITLVVVFNSLRLFNFEADI